MCLILLNLEYRLTKQNWNLNLQCVFVYNILSFPFLLFTSIAIIFLTKISLHHNFKLFIHILVCRYSSIISIFSFCLSLMNSSDTRSPWFLFLCVLWMHFLWTLCYLNGKKMSQEDIIQFHQWNYPVKKHWRSFTHYSTTFVKKEEKTLSCIFSFSTWLNTHLCC